jgi:flagellar biosynthesis/type III secretory pathway protein FliH
MAIYNDGILKDDLEKSYRELGWEEGLEEGLELGREEGRKEGREEGRKEGREEGREEGLEKVATAMLRARKYSRPEISELCGLSEDRLNSLSQELGLG